MMYKCRAFTIKKSGEGGPVCGILMMRVFDVFLGGVGVCCRFDFDFSLEESAQRRLDLSVKNNVSFMSRERELIGKVSWSCVNCVVYFIVHTTMVLMLSEESR